MSHSTLAGLLDSIESPDRSLVVANREAPRQLQRMLEGLFEDQPIDVREAELPGTDANTVLLVESGDIIATSPLEALQEAILLVNSDLYVTGTRTHRELELPDVLRNLDETRFRLRGYPESNNEKLVLITISRYIEGIAADANEQVTDPGTLRTSFQRLSRINDERGTRAVYEQLAETDLDVHIYGQPDWVPPHEFDVTIHGGTDQDFRNAWFVVYTPPEHDTETTPAALLAVEREPRKWDGFWTFEPNRITEIEEYVMREM